MKSILNSLMSVAAAALALTSCSTDATEDVTLKGERKPLEVNATIDRTRTSMAANHDDLEWSEGDEIKIYIGKSATENDVILHKIGDKITAAYKEGDQVFACYTSYEHDYNSKDVTAANIEIPKKQIQTEANVFAGQNLPMVAQGTIANGKVDLLFKPAGCVLVFNVYGPAGDEKIQSIQFETSVGCCGYSNCNLTVDPFVYQAYGQNTLATVTLDTPAPIDAEMPTDTKVGKNQVYLVVAPVNYPAGSKFIVTTDAGNTYTFETKNGIDCSQHTARVVNLNLANAPEMQPAIEVPTVPQQSADGAELVIKDIVFKNIDINVDQPSIKAYSDAELTEELASSWITFSNPVIEAGVLKCNIAANPDEAERTAYIGIKCAGVQAAIAVTQVAQGSTPAAPDPTVADLATFVGQNYGEHPSDTWTVTCGGNYNTLGSSTKQVAKCTLANYPNIVTAMGFDSPEKAAAVISKIALPAGYNTATLEYTSVKNNMQVGIAFSTDGVNWTKIMDLVDLSKTSTSGSQSYSFDQQDAGYYAFVIKATTSDSRIMGCKITYSQSKQ